MADKDVMLIVDDSKLARMIIRGVVQENNPEIEVFEAENGDAAIECAKEQNISLITMDYNMPGMNGVEVAEKLKELQPNARITLLTANIQEAIQGRADKLGIEFIAKPVNEEKIVNFLKAG